MSTGSAIIVLIALCAALWGVGIVLRERRLARVQQRDQASPASAGAIAEADPQR